VTRQRKEFRRSRASERLAAKASTQLSSSAGRRSPLLNRGFVLRVLLLFIAVFAIYARTFSFGFIWDDNAMIYDQPLVRASDGLWRFWFTTEAPDYFPLVSSLFWVQWRLWGMHAAGYHIINVLLHCANALLLWKLLEVLRVRGAYFCALLFAVHPVCVETVAWVTETKNTLPLALLLSSFLIFMYSDMERESDSNSRVLYVASILLFVASLLAKTAVVMGPVVLLLICYYRKGTIRRRDVVKAIPFFAASLVLGLVTTWFQSHRAIIHTQIRNDTLVHRIAMAGVAVWFYVWKALVPVHLSFVYHNWRLNPGSITAFLPVFLIVLLTGTLFGLRKKIGRGAFVAFAIYVIMLLPVLGIINIYFMRYSYVSDHWQYVALPALITLVVGGLATLSSDLFSNNQDAQGQHWHAGKLQVAIACVFGFVFMLLSYSYAGVFRSNEALFADIVSKNPEAWMARNNLGLIRAQQGRLDEALELYRSALRINSDLPEAYLNIGNLYSIRNQPKEALAAYQKGISIRDDAKTENALGELLLKDNQTSAAIDRFHQAIHLRPDYYVAHANLARMFMASGNYNEAVAEFELAIRIRSEDPDLQNQLAFALYRAGRLDDSIAQLEETLSRFPDYGPGWDNLAQLLHKAGRDSEADEAGMKGRSLSGGGNTANAR
jgi:tetratricopeptide (TPR) repeat protein